jgi:two-component system response regulator FixJ
MRKTISIVHGDEQSASRLESTGYRVRIFTSDEAFLAVQPSEAPDCVVLDIHTTGASGLDLLRIVAGRDRAPPVLVVSSNDSVSLAVEAMKLGAVDFLERPFEPEALLAAIDSACVLGQQMRDVEAAERQAAARLERLSGRLRQVLHGMVMGRPNKITAYELGLSVRTVEAYRAQLLTKLGVRSTAEAIGIALAGGVDPRRSGSGPHARHPGQSQPVHERLEGRCRMEGVSVPNRSFAATTGHHLHFAR